MTSTVTRFFETVSADILPALTEKFLLSLAFSVIAENNSETRHHAVIGRSVQVFFSIHFKSYVFICTEIYKKQFFAVAETFQEFPFHILKVFIPFVILCVRQFARSFLCVFTVAGVVSLYQGFRGYCKDIVDPESQCIPVFIRNGIFCRP